jgi:hypothetical protein
MDMARGGGGEDETSDDDDDDDDDDNNNVVSDNDETDTEDTNENDVVIDKTMESSIIGSATPDNESSSSSSNNFGLVVALWSSLVFDTILNKSKRLVLFPTTTLSSTITSTTTTTLLATTQLSSGFALAVGVSFLLWRDMENRHVESSSGDSFLLLSSSITNKEEEDTVLATRIRVRLLLHLTVFGLLCLTGQSMGYYFSNQAPFLGLSAAAVNIHNVLLCISTLMKEVKQEDGGTATLNIKKLYKSSSSKDGRRRNIAQWTPFLFRLGTVAAYVRCLVVGKDIIAQTLGLLSSVSIAGGVGIASSTAIVSNARLLALQFATLARLTLFAGVTNVLHTVSTTFMVKEEDSLRHHPFFATLSGMLGLGCLGVGGMIMLETFLLLSSVNTAIISNQPAVLGGLLLMLFGTFACWNSVLGIKRHLRSVATLS